MGKKASMVIALVIILVSGVTGVSASTLEAPGASNLLKLVPQAPTWQQVNTNGFGNQHAGEMTSLAVFNSQLYAGTSNAMDGAQIFRSQDGVTWAPVTQPGFGIAHDIRPPAILDLAVFNGRIYASTGRGDGPAQIWRAVDGVTWAPMVIHGFGDPDTVDITAFAEYNGWLYVGASNLISGAQIWRSYSGDNNTWTKVAPTAPGSAPASVTGLAAFNNMLYAAVGSGAPAQIWRSNGTAWTAVMSNGFGDSLTTATGGMAEFGGYLYVGAGNGKKGAQLWRTNDGATWQQVIDPGFGGPNNQSVEMVFVWQNYLYISVKNVQTGIALWRSADGTMWERANQDGFGDRNNTASNGSDATAEFLGGLYMGTVNITEGGELWRLQQPQLLAHRYLPVLLRGP